MGTYNKGILGAFSGKVGPVVGATWRGKDVMRSLPKKGNRVASATQVLQREKFIMATAFLTPLNSIISRYFGNNTGDKTRRNQAMSYHMREAIQYVEPDMIWDFSKVQISRGDLLGLNSLNAAAGTGQDITLSWTDNSGQGAALASDKLVVVVYEETSKSSYYMLPAGTRNQGSSTVALPAYFSGLSVHVWVAVVAADDKKYATSQYLGTVAVG